jgi:glycosyltransferase involved in cell wall biosynthesis
MTPESPIKVHVLYESSNGAEPHGCSVIRLLRPLSHPSISDRIELTYGIKVPEHLVDVVIIERLWVHQFNTVELLLQLDNLKSRGITIIYETDDDLLSVNSRAGDREWPSAHQKNIIRLLAREAHGVIVSTNNLAKTFSVLNTNIQVVENALDETLFTRKLAPRPNSKIKFGYMGTFTHLEDLIFVSAAIKGALVKFSPHVEFEIVGIGDEYTIRKIFGDAPVSIKRVPEKDVPYERFCQWMSENLQWDFGIAPLLQSEFSDSKSDIKFLDYSLVGIPGIYSNVPAYADTVQNNITGLLCDNSVDQWTEQIEKLVSSPDLTSSLSDAAYEYTNTHRTLKTNAANFLDAIKNIKNAKSREYEARSSTV